MRVIINDHFNTVMGKIIEKSTVTVTILFCTKFVFVYDF